MVAKIPSPGRPRSFRTPGRARDPPRAPPVPARPFPMDLREPKPARWEISMSNKTVPKVRRSKQVGKGKKSLTEVPLVKIDPKPSRRYSAGLGFDNPWA